VKAGALDRRVVIQTRTLTRNAYGEQVESWATLDTVWAQKLDVLGREFFGSQRELAEGTAKFRLRWRDDLSVTDRLSFDSKTYDIVQISELGRHEGLEIVAVARVS
jgi:SPP1 family predicted phage head-tail adaptor